ncbi:MAG TPA: hypothetical protein VJ719_01175 [Chthoniobacterales bacterium]|nr:hypothetical protein [Chthoniobacterales bacterium]
MTGRPSGQPPQQRDRRSGGRPRKYAEPSQPITVTLPNTTLRQLEHIDADRGRAIVKLARAASSQPQPSVQIVEIAENTGLVLVGPSEALSKVPFLRLVEVAPARYLLALTPGHDLNHLEIALNDQLDEPDNSVGSDRDLISTLLNHFKNFRKSDSVSMAQILLVELQPHR